MLDKLSNISKHLAVANRQLNFMQLNIEGYLNNNKYEYIKFSFSKPTFGSLIDFYPFVE